MIYIGADHRGYELKEAIKEWLKSEEYECEDVGAHTFDPGDDYIDFAIKVAEMVEGSESDKGILLCGSGHGMDIVANKFHSVRAILGYNSEVTQQGREDEDANILIIPAEWSSQEQALELVRIFLTTEKSLAERHARRRQKLNNLRLR